MNFLRPLKNIWTEFCGDPSDDRENYKRYCGAEPFKPVGPSTEVIHSKEVRFVKMKPLKQLVREKKISIEFVSDDGEFVRYKILPNGPTIGEWYAFEQKLMVVDCETVHVNQLKIAPDLYEEVRE